MARGKPALVTLVLVACKFAADGLGEASGDSPGMPTAGGEPTTTLMTPTSATGGEVETTAAVPPAGCGDETVDAGEACDDGADNGADRACTPVCTLNTCGDGYALAGVEACDDGNDDDSDACARCQEAVCGDGYVHANAESCDGMGESPDCDADCSQVSCGDGMVNMAAGEVCDLGKDNGNYGGGCNDSCSGPGPTCGDGTIDAPDEMCDEGLALPNHLACMGECKVIACMKGWGDCDGGDGNGCEIDHSNDKQHCGDCDTNCFGLQKCENGECKF